MNDSGTTAEKNIIAVPFAYEDGMNTSVNIDPASALNIYLQNLCVATASAKRHNPGCTVALVTNISEEDLPSEYKNVLKQHGVEIIVKPFDRFRFPADYRWSLAFYKLCALSYLSEAGYDKICYLDSDVYVQGSLDGAWKECDDALLLFDIKHGREKMNEDFGIEVKDLLKLENPAQFTHYGGEFFMASAENAKRFAHIAEEVYDKMVKNQFRTSKGDEFILCVAAEKTDQKIKNAGSFVRRFWTGWNFRMVNDSYRVNPVAVLHLPEEKNEGLPVIYRKYIKNGNIPDNETVWKICRLNGLPLKDKLRKIKASLSK